jgi:glycosyltransferase involved in cell wall biosynthesis
MKIGVYYPKVFPLSMKIYGDTIMQHLQAKGFVFTLFEDIDNIPQNVGLYWDPRVGGGALPAINKHLIRKPIVVTLHGAALFTLKIKEIRFAFSDTLWMLNSKYRFRKDLKKYQHHFEKIITVSEYAKQEIVDNIRIDPDRIVPVYHAVDTALFKPAIIDTPAQSESGYFFHVSVYQPKKNIDRIIEAYLSIADQDGIPDLFLLVPNYNKTCSHPKVSILTKQQSRGEVAVFLQNAFGFIFPSLHESFGLPILEAMACGVPVITSNVTGCPEIAGDAALLVNPRSTDEIAEAMLKLVENKKLRQELIEKGLKRHSTFSWGKSASLHYGIFKDAIEIFNNKS